MLRRRLLPDECIFVLCASTGAPAELSNPELWKAAVRQLQAFGRALTPAAALQCVLHTWDALLGVLGVWHRHAQADDYMPVMAWVIVRARPSRLISQLHFIYAYILELDDRHEMWMAHFTAACDMVCRVSP